MVLWIKDFRVVGFLTSRGIKFTELRFDSRGDVEFAFHESSELISLMAEYSTSPEFRYDSACKVINDLIKSKIRSRV